MDARVLQAQQWVNRTYAGVPGYVPAPESGVTGWPTMYALTRGLQSELGIPSLSDTFGPTTLARVTERGGISAADSGNLVSLLQCALYCKGYDPTGITGTFGPGTSAAVTSVLRDCGVAGPASPVAPKVVKALLTMDAYVLQPGGSAGLRQAQQWLNGRYLARSAFFVGPCDGVFSRDGQRSLVLALQYELGLSDDTATGTFGPTTQAGVKAHVLAAGARGVFVSLFTTALIANRVRVGSTVYGTFTSSFGAPVTAAVKAFQSFSALPVTGKGDFATWCSLLVSTGDPDRPGTACDTATPVTDARAKALRAAGCTIVARYLDDTPGSSLHKALQPGEPALLLRHGLKIVPVSQYDGSSPASFTDARGYSDAVAAHDRAAGYGFPAGTVVYFAVDVDATQADLDANVVPYFSGVQRGLAARGGRYVCGVYGSRNVCSQVSQRVGARWSFVSGMSTGFSGNLGFPLPDNWSLDQVQTRTVGSGAGAVTIDKDVHRPGTDPGTSHLSPTSGPTTQDGTP